MWPKAVLLAFVVACAGCAGKEAPPTPPPGTTSSSASAATTPAVAPALGHPGWSPGVTGWKWSLTSSVLASPLIVETAVTRDMGAAYFVGVDTQAGYDKAYPLHILPLGHVNKADLSWDAHGKPVSLLRFPIKDQESWTTDLWMANGLQVTVTSGQIQEPAGSADGFLVNVTYPTGAIALQADYSPTLGQFVRIASYFGAPNPFATATMTGIQTSTEFLELTSTELLRKSTPGGSQPTPPATFTVAAAEGNILVACFLGSAQGAYAASILAPDGGHAECTHTNQPSQTSTALQTHNRAAAAGQWTVTVPPPPQGFTNVEAFHVKRLA